MKDLTPKDHAEAVATFRHAVIGPVCAREVNHGDLAEVLREISQTRVRAPNAKLTKKYSVPTLERWLYAYRRGGLPALRPRGRSDRGRGRALTDELRQLSERAPNFVDEAALREALTVRERRRVRRDTTVSVLGRIYELEQGFLAGRVVDIVYSHLDDPAQPEVEHEEKRYKLSLVDPRKNAHRTRPPRQPESAGPQEPVVFDPSCANLSDHCDDEEDLDAIF